MDRRQICQFLATLKREWLDEQAGNLVETDPWLAVPVLGEDGLGTSYSDGVIDDNTAAMLLEELAARPVSMRQEIESKLFEWYLCCIDVNSGYYGSAEEQLKAEGGRFDNPVPPENPSQMWSLVRFKDVVLDRAGPERLPHAIVNAWCAWDEEHGVAMFFENGKRLVHVSILGGY